MQKKLLDVVPAALVQGLSDTQRIGWEACSRRNPQLTQIVLNSKAVKPGGLFIALPGRETDGRAFIQDAIARGAAIVLAEASDKPSFDLSREIRSPQTLLWVNQLDQWLPNLALNFYGDVSSQLSLVGVTGTNGKTSVTYMLAQVLGHGTAGLLGTLGVGAWDALEPTRNTTADLLSIYASLANMALEGVATACMEVSSHAIDQGRVRGLKFHSALFTNLSHDHLDYHGDFASYGRVKQSLFTDYPIRHGVFNLSDPFVYHTCRWLLNADRLPNADSEQQGPKEIWGYHLGPTPSPLLPVDRQVWLESIIEQHQASMRLSIRIQNQPFELCVPLLGRFNVENVMALITLLVTLDCANATYLSRIGSILAPPGRMQQIKKPGCPCVVIDYAHTPDALQKVLHSIRPLCDGVLWCVFGCGGNRDIDKRPVMGQVAVECADRVCVTSDNPRNEDPNAIVRGIVSGIPVSKRAQVQVEMDRGKAIRTTLTHAKPRDWVLIAGKGHEAYQEISGKRHRYSDQVVVETFWSTLSGAG